MISEFLCITAALTAIIAARYLLLSGPVLLAVVAAGRRETPREAPEPRPAHARHRDAGDTAVASLVGRLRRARRDRACRLAAWRHGRLLRLARLWRRAVSFLELLPLSRCAGCLLLLGAPAHASPAAFPLDACRPSPLAPANAVRILRLRSGRGGADGLAASGHGFHHPDPHRDA